MNRLTKVVETGEYGEKSGRVACVLKPETLPEANRGFSWRGDTSFSVADALLADGGLKEVFRAAVRHGYAIVGPAG
jgi:hypothetical protein